MRYPTVSYVQYSIYLRELLTLHSAITRAVWATHRFYVLCAERDKRGGGAHSSLHNSEDIASDRSGVDTRKRQLDKR